MNAPPPSHPEHREHTAWGTAGGWTTPGPGRGTPRSEELPLDLEDWPPYETGALGTTAAESARQLHAAGRTIPRPRQEYVDAFDGAFDGPPGGRLPGGPRRPAEALLAAEPRPAAAGGTDRGTDRGQTGGKGAGKDGGRNGGKTGGKGGGKSLGKGRTLSGIAAAAVVTVLAVVVGGQLIGGEKDHTGTGGAGGKGSGGQSAPDDAPATPTGAASPSPDASVTAAPADYDQLMARQYPLDPQLALSGAFTTVPGTQAAPGKGRVMRFRVDVEKGLPLDAGLFAQTVFKTLNDPRSWGHGGTMTFERVSTGPADIVVTLASPGTTAKWCEKSGLDTTVDNVSCDAASTPRTMINAYRWAEGAATFGPQRMHEYRQMLINHEVGHRLGHSHVGCPKEGALAPVMMQQTKFLSLDGGPTCKPNPWPFP
nr:MULTISPECIES: DUF3152 domain-containing protein [unclassified Streptomyces]